MPYLQGTAKVTDALDRMELRLAELELLIERLENDRDIWKACAQHLGSEVARLKGEQ